MFTFTSFYRATVPMNLNNSSLNSSTGFSLPPPLPGNGLHTNAQRGGANAVNTTAMSGIGALNYSTDSNLSGTFSLPRNNHLLNAPPFRHKRTYVSFSNRFRLFNAAPVLITSQATPPPPPTSQQNPAGGRVVGTPQLHGEGQMTPVGNIIAEATGDGGNEEVSFGTPTFGMLQPRGVTNTWKVRINDDSVIRKIAHRLYKQLELTL